MAQNELQREQKRDEQLATDFGTDPKATRKRFERTRTVTVGRADDPISTRTDTYTRKKDTARLRQAKSDFESRGGASGDVEAQNRGASGGGLVSTGDFGPGAIRLNTVTPVNSKVGGR